MAPRPQAEVELSASISPDTVSLSRLEEPLRITITAKTVSSSKPSSGIYIDARMTSLDNRGPGLYCGALRLRSVSNPENIISFAPASRFSYSTADWDPDLRKNDFHHFLVIPAVGRGDLTVTHEITGSRIFQYSRTRPSDVSPGSEYRIEITEQGLGAYWWTFEDEAEGKMFFQGMFPSEDGISGLKSEDPAFVEQRYAEGYIYSYHPYDLKYKVKEDSPAIIRFVE
ncbi:hypothetical protein M434DRAFT_264712 [Hypoxylon sp. CO27-5]|nr:hypothetical protein M434DRAFT_264712 [Hypoxylon sp. CO27-5]